MTPTQAEDLSVLRFKALALVDAAAIEKDPQRRKDLEQQALRCWQEARAIKRSPSC